MKIDCKRVHLLSPLYSEFVEIFVVRCTLNKECFDVVRIFPECS